MTKDQLVYLIFGVVLLAALVFDLGLISKKGQKVTIKQALSQTIFWVALAVGFFIFLWFEEGSKPALEYISAYLMEWSLSVDNIFVFILIFTAFSVKEKNYSRVLLIGILMAIVLRVLFITVGVAIVEKFSWVLYIFGAFLLYTGYKMFSAGEEEQFNPEENKVYLFLKKIMPLASHDGNGKFVVKENGRKLYTTLFVVVILLASIDLVFALDSIPAVLGISRDKLVIYTSNIFAVLGLRSLFFLLRNAVNTFEYLPKGIAVVLIFIGLKMLGEHWINEWISNSVQAFISLAVIILCIVVSIIFSQMKLKKNR
jgi:tellurite resistance protein TerC